jgi:hypothetical protein
MHCQWPCAHNTVGSGELARRVSHYMLLSRFVEKSVPTAPKVIGASPRGGVQCPTIPRLYLGNAFVEPVYTAFLVIIAISFLQTTGSDMITSGDAPRCYVNAGLCHSVPPLLPVSNHEVLEVL